MWLIDIDFCGGGCCCCCFLFFFFFLIFNELFILV